MTLPGRPLSELVFVAFDTETTGLDPARDHLVEVAAVKFRVDGQVLGRFQTLVDPLIDDPDFSIPEDLTAIHGITDAMVRGAPSAFDAVDALLCFCMPSDILVAHNAPFDIGFLQATMLDADDWPLVPQLMAVCTRDLSRARWPGQGNRLADAAGRLGIVADGWHRAPADAEVCRQVFLKLAAMPYGFGKTWQPQYLKEIRGIRPYQVIPECLTLPTDPPLPARALPPTMTVDTSIAPPLGLPGLEFHGKGRVEEEKSTQVDGERPW